MPFLHIFHFSSDNPLAISFTLLALVAVVYTVYQRLLPYPLPGIPHDAKAARRLLGDAPDMLREVGQTRELNKWLSKQVDKFQAPLCQVFVEPFSKPWLLLADPVEAQDIMMRRPEFDRSSFITDGLAPLDGFHARMKTGSDWKTTRAWLQDLMGPSFLNNVVGPRMYLNSLRLIDLWKLKVHVASGRPFDVNEDLDHSALDGMLSFVFDQHFEHTALGPQTEAVSRLDPSTLEMGLNGEVYFPSEPLDDFISALYETVDAIDKVTKSVSPQLAMWWIRQTPRYRKVTATKRKVIREQIRGALQRLDTPSESRTAIEHMMLRERKAAEKQGRKPNYENPTLIDEIAGQFIAGLHTTSTTLAWTFIYLTRLPKIQTKLRSALHDAYAEARAEDRIPSLAEVTKTRVPYLEAVLEEALRLHATSLARQTNCDTVVLGHHIPKGTNVILIANGPGFHIPSLVVDSAKRSPTAKSATGWDETRDLRLFDPERWLVKGANTGEGVVFDANAAPQIAFGMGPRSCWGRRLAYLELRMVVTLVFWNFDLLDVTPVLADPKASYGIVHRADQCYLRLKIRE
ncbi:hypothetical protein VHEMI04148 [[Torrubiella] hemipterigena]|uniref:Cytochrome P450 monooxygenase n=1 Tax=[Torrubiella] hemipterigena TaxID=1531966 RepID=A0A0A1T0I0_9HYPO|nr:hypothetical protein VHEMI04148 [[Torrubiella] hemipterigena]